MKTKFLRFWTAYFICLAVFSANGATHYLVPTNPAAANPYTSWETAGTSVIDVVNAAMTNAITPRIVWASNGVYVLTNTVTITNDVTLKGVNGRDTTIFNGNAAYNFNLSHSNCVLEELTITNCFSGSGGGGMKIARGIVTNCIITDCINSSSTGGEGGGGIKITSAGIVANSIIRRNTSYLADGGGGGIALGVNSTSIIENCIIEGNLAAKSHAGGIAVGYGTPGKATIKNCLVRYNMVTNASSYGGGMFFQNCNSNVLVANCTIVSNYGIGSGGIGFVSTAATNIILNCIIISNKASVAIYDNMRDISHPSAARTVAYSCSTSNQTFDPNYSGNTTNDPGFIDFAEENYRLNSTSPCINSGTNQDWMTGAYDLDGHLRVDKFSGRVDMGAYEYVFSGTMIIIR